MTDNFLTPAALKEHLLPILSSEPFLKMEGLGMEVPFFICPFLPKDYNEVRKVIRQLVHDLENRGHKVLELNLFHIVIDILNEQEILQEIFDQESSMPKDMLKETLQCSLDMEEYLIPKIKRLLSDVPDCEIVFLTGIGEVFPYLRTHNILHNLQSVVTKQPMLAFYPGAYCNTVQDGQVLRLFNLLLDDKYYRAFNILLYDNHRKSSEN